MNPAGKRHIPVLGREAVEMLAPRDGGIYVDATFGAGGYSRAILAVAGTRVVGIDRDRSAVSAGFDLVDRSGGRLTLVEDRFSNLAGICAAQGISAVDGVVMDVGVSSMQLDEADRGFSFRLGGPLDMRMGHDGPTATDVIAGASETDLANIIYIFGEERHSRSVARAIVAARKQAPIVTTRALADMVAKVVRSKPGEIHPATRTFQALRIFVNEELDELHLALSAAERTLKPGGRLVVVSFHSLEDRIVKNFMVERSKAGGGSRHLPEIAQAAPSFHILTKRPVTPGGDEISANPRARSAKLRAAERTAAPAHPPAALPGWPTLTDVMGRR
ncbi:MAG: 16S rRNA (cytosine(1402)-N(4))-methyltransferase RsmH [Bradyrhizobium sp.]|jgi:16S rRNA (cytosine1402-N4)-methyltransferase